MERPESVAGAAARFLGLANSLPRASLFWPLWGKIGGECRAGRMFGGITRGPLASAVKRQGGFIVGARAKEFPIGYGTACWSSQLWGRSCQRIQLKEANR